MQLTRGPTFTVSAQWRNAIPKGTCTRRTLVVWKFPTVLVTFLIVVARYHSTAETLGWGGFISIQDFKRNTVHPSEKGMAESTVVGEHG